MHGAIYSITVQPLTERQTGYTAKSFEPICQTFKNDQVIVARQGTYKNLADIMAASKAKPGGLNYGSPGLGTIPHLSMAELSRISKVPFNHVPFKGPAEFIAMTLGDRLILPWRRSRPQRKAGYSCPRCSPSSATPRSPTYRR